MPGPYTTHINDDNMSHIVIGESDKDGYGVLGYYTNEFDAYRIRRRVIKNGGHAKVYPCTIEDIDKFLKGSYFKGIVESHGIF